MGCILRLQAWPELLADYIDICMNKPFNWGYFDCCIFVAGGIHAITGTDHFLEFKGKYNSEESAQLLIESLGFYTIDELISSKYEPHKSISFARRGDVVSAKINKDSALGICLGSRSWFSGPNKLFSLPTNKCFKSWKIE